MRCFLSFTLVLLMLTGCVTSGTGVARRPVAGVETKGARKATELSRVKEQASVLGTVTKVRPSFIRKLGPEKLRCTPYLVCGTEAGVPECLIVCGSRVAQLAMTVEKGLPENVAIEKGLCGVVTKPSRQSAVRLFRAAVRAMVEDTGESEKFGGSHAFIYIDSDLYDRQGTEWLKTMVSYLEEHGWKVHIIPVPVHGRGSAARAVALRCLLKTGGVETIYDYKKSVNELKNMPCRVLSAKTQIGWSMVPFMAGDLKALPAILLVEDASTGKVNAIVYGRGLECLQRYMTARVRSMRRKE